MGMTRTATVWLGVSQDMNDSPWPESVSDDHLETLGDLGLVLVTFGNGVTGPDLYGLCMKGNFCEVNDRTKPLVKVLDEWKRMPESEWLGLLEQALWIGPKEQHIHLGLWIW